MMQILLTIWSALIRMEMGVMTVRPVYMTHLMMAQMMMGMESVIHILFQVEQYIS